MKRLAAAPWAGAAWKPSSRVKPLPLSPPSAPSPSLEFLSLPWGHYIFLLARMHGLGVEILATDKGWHLRRGIIDGRGQGLHGTARGFPHEFHAAAHLE